MTRQEANLLLLVGGALDAMVKAYDIGQPATPDSAIGKARAAMQAVNDYADLIRAKKIK